MKRSSLIISGIVVLILIISSVAFFSPSGEYQYEVWWRHRPSGFKGCKARGIESIEEAEEILRKLRNDRPDFRCWIEKILIPPSDEKGSNETSFIYIDFSLPLGNNRFFISI